MTRYLVAGLGNPGPKYADNRHNVGFRCVERVASAHGLSFDRRQKRARVALGTILQRSVILAKPQTYMNKSGYAVGSLVHFYRVPMERILVVYDDLDLPLGTIRLRPSGGTGGHRGMRSIINQLGRQDFPRLRIGIGRPPGRMDPADYVLQDFSADEEELVEEALEQAAGAIEAWLVEGIDEAMTRYNRGA
ncbi:MAG: aminoacyl-tRNA hydrolase [Chloroflexota bacterium]